MMKESERVAVCRGCIKECGDSPPCVCYQGEWWHYSRLTAKCALVPSSKEDIDLIMSNMDKVMILIKQEIS